VEPEPVRCYNCAAPAQHVSPSGFHYCDQHYICYRGHMMRWRQREDDGKWLCACYWGKEAYEQAVQAA